MYYKEFKDMVKIHPEAKSKNYEIKHIQAYEESALGKLQNPEYARQKDQLVCVLKDNSKQEIVMSDSWMEQETNIEMIRNAKGHILIGGMGIGMVLLALQDKPEIKSITVVEISQELHDFIRPNILLNNKVKIIINDIHKFIPEIKYDFVYCDIWNDISSDNYEEMQDLSFKFKDIDKVVHWREDRTTEMYEEDSYY